MINLGIRDEREQAVDSAADRLSFLVLAYGLLVIVAIRAFNGEATWDLLALVILGGFAGLAYRVQKRVVTRPWAIVLIGTIAAAAIVAAVMTLLSR
jgi:predicted PurR-regulated permease PerM